MRAIDTNVVVRLITRDDARQANSAEVFIERGAWISLLVLMESIRVLDSVYGVGGDELATALEMLLDHRSLTVQDPDVVMAALALFRTRPSLGFSDCLMFHAARKAGHLPLGTFDRILAKVEGCEKI